jgi:hypothetical protein
MSSSPRSAAPGQGLPQGIRTLISFLLFVHLFLLLIAVAANFPPLSPLRQSLGQRLREKGLLAHLQILDMDRAYDTRLTHGRRIDIDHRLRAEIFTEDEKARTVDLPPPANWRMVRGQRYASLARNVALAEALGGERAGLLPAAIARGLLLEDGAQRVHLICQGRFLLSREESARGMDPGAPEKSLTVYEADAKLAEGELIFQQRAAPLETAPPAPAASR